MRQKLNAMGVMVLLFTVTVFASEGDRAKGGNGGGKGRTKIDFKVTADSPTTSRLFAKIDVSAAAGSLAETGSKSANDNLAGYLLEFSIQAAGASPTIFTGVANEKGKITTPFDGKLTANGAILQIKYTGLDLVVLFPLNTADGKYEVPVTLSVTAKKVLVDSAGAPVLDVNGQAQADPAVAPIVLSTQTVTFKYDTKSGKIKGRNF